MKTYIVKYRTFYSEFGYRIEDSIVMFKTNDKEYAEKYVKKFNRILEKAENHIQYMESLGLVKESQYIDAPLVNEYEETWYLDKLTSRVSEVFYTKCICQDVETRP